jgi:hypothetical protein
MVFRARFIPKNVAKYVGNIDKIFARSSWELTVMKFFDASSAVKSWGSEEQVIPYFSPVDSKVHEYWPDFFVEYVDKEGATIKEVVEVKPRHESEEKYAKSERSKAALIINEAKWKAANLYCESRGWRFRVITEHSIYHQGKKKEKLDGKPSANTVN